MRWIAPPEKDAVTATLEKRLWDAADQFRANFGLKAQEYSGPILGLIFLRFAEVRFAARRAELAQATVSPRRAAALMNRPRITPRACSTWRRKRASTICGSLILCSPTRPSTSTPWTRSGSRRWWAGTPLPLWLAAH